MGDQIYKKDTAGQGKVLRKEPAQIVEREDTMRYEFRLDDLDEVMDAISERLEDEAAEFRQIKIAEKDGSELWAFGYRIVIPELDISVREGIEYCEDDDGEEEPVYSVIVYQGAYEKDPLKFDESYCSTYVGSVVMNIARGRDMNDDPKCYIDDEEFELLT